MMAGVSEEVKKRILKQYYENMYEDEDADQEYFDSIRNVNHDVQGEELNDEEDEDEGFNPDCEGGIQEGGC